MPLNRTLMEGWSSMGETGETGDVGRAMGWGLQTPASSSPEREGARVEERKREREREK